MLKKTTLLFCVLMAQVLVLPNRSSATTFPTVKPLVYVDSEITEAIMNETFTVSAKIFNLTNNELPDPVIPGRNIPLGNLYGLDIEFTWNATILEYLGHTTTIPVESYPDVPGILHEPVIPVRDEAIPDAGILNVAYASRAPAPFFNNPNASNTVFQATFKVKMEQTSELKLTTVKLSGFLESEGVIREIASEVRNGLVSAPPVASFTFSPSNPLPNDIIEFDATASRDPDGTIISYDWDFGDNITGNGPVVTHQYVDAGVYAVKLSVTDNLGLTNSTTTPVGVGTTPPMALFTYSPDSPIENEEATFDASSSYSPQRARIVSFRWNFGDGSILISEKPTTTHTYQNAGTFRVNLTITDEIDLTNSTVGFVVISRGFAAFTIEADVGSIYFRGEKAEFYILTKFLGQPTSVTKVSAKVYEPDGKVVYYQYPQNISLPNTGLYRTLHIVPADTLTNGTYTLVVQAEYNMLKASTLKSFLVSPTLTGWNAWLNGIDDNIATIIIPSLKQIKVNLTDIKAQLLRIEGNVGIINSTVGLIKTNLALINATIVDIIIDNQGQMLARLDYYLGTAGTITAKLSDINAQVEPEATPTPLYVTAVFSAIAAVVALAILLMLRKKTP